MSRDRDIVEQQLTAYGFTVWANINAGGTKTIQALDSDGINASITLDNDETFKLEYMIPSSIAKVTIGPCGPFHNESHFMKMLRKMRTIVMKLKEE